MKFYLHGMFGAVPVVIARVDWNSDTPLNMDRHMDRAHIFDTTSGDDMADLARLASSDYGFPFYPAAVEPELSQSEFDKRVRHTEMGLLTAFGSVLDTYIGPMNTQTVVIKACLDAMSELPAFRNQEIINELQLIAAQIITRRVCFAMRLTA